MNQGSLSEMRNHLRILQEENSRLADQQGDLLLLGLVGESLGKAEEESDLLADVLEKACVLLDLPAALVLEGTEENLRVSAAYLASSSQDLVGMRFGPPPARWASVAAKEGLCQLLDSELDPVTAFLLEQDFPIACSMVFNLPAAVTRSRWLLVSHAMVCKSRENHETLIARLVDMLRLRLENLGLLRALRQKGEWLEELVGRRTEQLRLRAQERELLIAELENKISEMERFHYTVAHDLRSPLITIRGFVGELRECIDAADLAEAREQLPYIEGAASRMHQLLTDLLELSRAGRSTNPPQEVDFAGLCQGICEDLRAAIEGAGAQILIPQELPTLWGDPLRISQIIQNLLENALKYRNAARPLEVRLQAQCQNSQVHIQVSDNGKGLDPRYLERIFNLFEKLERTTPGTGIGLALVRRAAESMGGKVWAESLGLGEGCTFHLLLPLPPSTDGAKGTPRDCFFGIMPPQDS